MLLRENRVHAIYSEWGSRLKCIHQQLPELSDGEHGVY